MKNEELVGGNGLVEMGTFVAILLGTILGGVLIATKNGGEYVSIVVVAIAGAGYLVSRLIPSAPPAAPDLSVNWNPASETWANLKFTRTNRTVFLSMLGISWFWFYGATFLSQFPNSRGGRARGCRAGGDVLLLTSFSVGIGVGSLLCERLSGHKVEVGLVPFGSIGLTLFALDSTFGGRPRRAPQ